MKTHVQSFLKCIVVVIIFILASTQSAFSQMVHDFTQTVLYEKSITMTANQSVRIATINSTPGCDPVIHLVNPTGLQVAYNDNGNGNLNCLVNYRSQVTGIYKLIIRSKNNSTSGNCDLLIDQVLIESGIPVGGQKVPMNNIRKGEEFRTVKLPNGNEGRHKLYLLSNQGRTLTRLQSGAYEDWCAKWTASDNFNSTTFLIGSNTGGGKVRFVRNDAPLSGHDPDGDGLGTELEREIGTCSTLSGFAGNFDCSSATDARDTDGDGISDGWEYLGRYDRSPVQPLPKWGANPRHKDFFIEYDFMRRTQVENEQNVSHKMTSSAALYFSAVYSDSFTVSPLKRAYHAAVLNNPDRLPGISVHFDIGVEPVDTAHAIIYGDWGGYTAVDAVMQDGDYVGVKPGVAWRTNMERNRHGIFRYGLGYTDGGASCGPGFACSTNFHSGSNTAHEWGHSLYIGHSGVMYGGTADPNCMPNYPSLMNYSYLGRAGIGFSDGYGYPMLNNNLLEERNVINPSNTVYLNQLSSVFSYWVNDEEGHVDWNRNGKFDREPVRAYANFRPGSGCEFTKYNNIELAEANTFNTPVLARLGKTMYMFYLEEGHLMYRSSSSSWNCPEPSADGCADGEWSEEKNAGMEGIGVDVVPIDNRSLRVITITWQGEIKQRILNVIPFAPDIWSGVTDIGNSAAGEPSLSTSADGTYLIYKGTDNLLHYKKLVNDVWSADKTALQSLNTPIRINPGWCYASSIQTYLPWKEETRGLYALVPAQDKLLDMWYFNPETEFWEKTNVLEGSRPGPIHGKPGLAYVPYHNDKAFPGRVYMVYTEEGDPGADFNGIARMRMSYVKVEDQGDGTFVKTEKLGLDSPFQNVWYTAYGMSLLYDPSVDTNLRCLVTKFNEGDPILIFYPKADAIQDYDMRNNNDWQTIHDNLCEQLGDLDGVGGSPIRCPGQD